MSDKPLIIPECVAGSASINEAAHRAFQAIGSQQVVDRFLKRFRTGQGDNLSQIHAYQELRFGEWAVTKGFSVAYSPRIGVLTPDWRLTRDNYEGLLEVTTLHAQQELLSRIEQADLGECVVYDIDRKDAGRRCLLKVDGKLDRYRELCDDRFLILGIHLDFDLGISPYEMMAELEPAGLWRRDPLLGILFQCGEWPYRFVYFPRPNGTNAEFVCPADTHAIRHAILRPNQPIESCVYPSDDSDYTRHLGIRDNGRLVAVASFYEGLIPQFSASSPQGAPAVRIRGMAVLPEYRGKGLGSILVEAGIRAALEWSPPPQFVWCNARTTACGYYAKLGFTPQGDEFEIEGIGPHYVMVKQLP